MAAGTDASKSVAVGAGLLLATAGQSASTGPVNSEIVVIKEPGQLARLCNPIMI